MLNHGIARFHLLLRLIASLHHLVELHSCLCQLILSAIHEFRQFSNILLAVFDIRCRRLQKASVHLHLVSQHLNFALLLCLRFLGSLSLLLEVRNTRIHAIRSFQCLRLGAVQLLLQILHHATLLLVFHLYGIQALQEQLLASTQLVHDRRAILRARLREVDVLLLVLRRQALRALEILLEHLRAPSQRFDALVHDRLRARPRLALIFEACAFLLGGARQLREPPARVRERIGRLLLAVLLACELRAHRIRLARHLYDFLAEFFHHHVLFACLGFFDSELLVQSIRLRARAVEFHAPVLVD